MKTQIYHPGNIAAFMRECKLLDAHHQHADSPSKTSINANEITRVTSLFCDQLRIP